jgi:hypothetical protein
MMRQRKVKDKEVVALGRTLFNNVSSIVAIPARNEAERIGKCLSALAMQRDGLGAPIVAGTFGVLLFANNCSDNTAAIAIELKSSLPYPLEVLEAQLPASMATAGGARRQAMDEAAARLGSDDNILLTTDADSLVTPSWLASNIKYLQRGVDCVAGFIDAEPYEIMSCGPAFLARGRLEDTYLRLAAEIYARCDPRPHDPWPNHRVSSGASLAVTKAVYHAVGGMPAKALGEDNAFTALLDEHGFKVRHALDVTVVTSCRLDGRASGGAADTMRYRRDNPDAVCDDEIEPAVATLHRATMRGVVRKAWQERGLEQALSRFLNNDSRLERQKSELVAGTFANAWKEIKARHPKLQKRPPLRPSDLPRQIAAARFILRHLRVIAEKRNVRADKCLHADLPALVGT